jgi:hypothetical protein
MRTDESTQPDRAAGIAGVTPWCVENVRPLAVFMLEVKFADGTQGFNASKIGSVHNILARLLAFLAAFAFSQ